MVFYNVENLFDVQDDPRTNDEDFTPTGKMHWTQDRYERKLQQLAEAIGFSGRDLPLVIGLAEVENRKVVEDLAATPPLNAMHYRICHQDSPDERGIDVALLVDPDIGELEHTEWLNVPMSGDRTRDILHATINLMDQPLHVFVNHWPSRGEGDLKSAPKRMQAARTLRSAVDALMHQDGKAHIVIMGDLNDEPMDASLKDGLRTDELISGDRGADLYDLVGMDRTAPQGSISYDGQWQYFDHLIVSRELVWPSDGGIHALSASSVKDERLIFHHPKYGDQPNRTFSGAKYHRDGFSDHLPVVLRLE